MRRVTWEWEPSPLTRVNGQGTSTAQAVPVPCRTWARLPNVETEEEIHKVYFIRRVRKESRASVPRRCLIGIGRRVVAESVIDITR